MTTRCPILTQTQTQTTFLKVMSRGNIIGTHKSWFLKVNWLKSRMIRPLKNVQNRCFDRRPFLELMENKAIQIQFFCTSKLARFVSSKVFDSICRSPFCSQNPISDFPLLVSALVDGHLKLFLLSFLWPVARYLLVFGFSQPTQPSSLLLPFDYRLTKLGQYQLHYTTRN